MLGLLMLSIAVGMSSCSKDKDPVKSLENTVWSKVVSTSELNENFEDPDDQYPEGSQVTYTLKFINANSAKFKIQALLLPNTSTILVDFPYTYNDKTKEVLLKLSQASNVVIDPEDSPASLNEVDIKGQVNWDREEIRFFDPEDNIEVILKKVN